MFSPQSYDSARHGAALVQRTDRGVIRVVGADATAWLQGLLTNDVTMLGRADEASGAPVEARYSAYLTPHGRMITDARVLRVANGVLLDVPAALAASLAVRLDALIFAEDAQVADVSAATVVLELHGPRTPELMAAVRAQSSQAIRAIARDDQFGVPGFALLVEADASAALENLFAAAGAARLTLETWHVLRVEAGRPAFLVDMDTDTIPLEAGIEDRAISFTKGCYVGQEIIVRVTQRGGGRVAKKLVGLALPGVVNAAAAMPAPDAIIRAGDRDIGRVTSAVYSPTAGHVIALGYVHRDFLAPGTPVSIAGAATVLPAVVAPTPFV